MKSDCTRREFMSSCAICGLGAAWSALVPPAEGRPFNPGKRNRPELYEATYQQTLPDGRVQCLTCPNKCITSDGDITLCHTRINRNGKLYTMTYGKPCVIFTDPLEKNPLYHVDPGSKAIGIGTAGCNLRCTYCQNWEFSQVGPNRTRNMDLSPANLIQRVQERNLKWITFSYTEPVAYYEYALAIAKQAKSMGIKVAVVTAGYISPNPLAELMTYCDAFSVTLKGYDNDFYQNIIGCSLDDVWKTITQIAHSPCWMEVVNLIVPTLNDQKKGIQRIAQSLVRLDKDIPLHFLRFSPAYKLKNIPVTPVETLQMAHATAKAAGLKYVYIDLPAHKDAHTYCPACQSMLIQRAGFSILSNAIKNGHCPECGCSVPGIGL